MNRILLVSIFIFHTISLSAQSRYMVFFKDKINSPWTVNNPSQFLSAKSLQRRQKQGISVEESDIPVNPSYISGVAATGAEVFYTTRWLNGLLVQSTPTINSLITALPYVDHVDYVAPGAPLMVGGRVDYSQQKMGTEEERTYFQNDMIGIQNMHDEGYMGNGIEIAVIDVGFEGVNTAGAFSDLLLSGRILSTFDYVTNSGNVYHYPPHGTIVLSTMAATISGSFTGASPGASYHLFVSEDNFSEYRVEEYNWLFAAEKADSLGADIITSSLGYFDFDDPSMNYQHDDLDGKTAVITRAADMAASRGILVVTSAGNQGDKTWGKITFPSDCFYCIAVGSVTADREISAFSSRGATADNRLKPDVVTMGSGVAVINPDNSVSGKSGTSLAAPQIAGLMAGVMEAFPNYTVAEWLTILKQSADRAYAPDNTYGYGIPHFMAIKNYLGVNPQELPLAVYPNPVWNKELHFKVKDPNITHQAGYKLFDIQGQLVSEGEMHFSWLYTERIFSVQTLKAGMYILSVLTESEVLKMTIMIR